MANSKQRDSTLREFSITEYHRGNKCPYVEDDTQPAGYDLYPHSGHVCIQGVEI